MNQSSRRQQDKTVRISSNLESIKTHRDGMNNPKWLQNACRISDRSERSIARKGRLQKAETLEMILHRGRMVCVKDVVCMCRLLEHCRRHRYLSQSGEELALLLSSLLENLLAYRTITHDESPEHRMSCTVNVLVRPPPPLINGLTLWGERGGCTVHTQKLSVLLCRLLDTKCFQSKLCFLAEFLQRKEA